MPDSPVLAVRLGRGRTGGSTLADWLIQRAQSQGRSVIVADGDRRNPTLAGLHPGALQPPSEESADVREWVSEVLDRMVTEQRSVVLDLGGGDRVLAEYGRDLGLVEFCHAHGVRPLALFMLGPDPDDLNHVHALWEAGGFRPDEGSVVVLNEHMAGERTPASAFQSAMESPKLKDMVQQGARLSYLYRLPCMARVRASGEGFYANGASKLGPTDRFIVSQWVKRMEAGAEMARISGWLP